MYDLNTFRERVQHLYHSVRPFADDRRPTVDDLAQAVGLSRSELSRRLNGSGKQSLSCANAQAVVRALAKWGALQTQAQAIDLLVLLGCTPFTLAEWRVPPLDQLAPLSQTSQAQLEHNSNNLPLQTTTFVGREQEIAALTRLLTGTPLLSIIGAGGMGKTRLAIELTARLLPDYPDGCWLVGLAPLTDDHRVVSTVANVLGVREEPERSIGETLVDWLRPRKLLLVLDNCEHLLAACAELVTLLLTTCPHIRILITSREPLGVAAENEWRLNPLSLPTTTQMSSTEAQEYAAVALFVNQARAVLPRFRLNERNTASVLRICQQLEGIPLALELAAPLVKVLSPEQLAHRLDDRLRLLHSSDPTAPSRQQTLRASIEWSYDLLGAVERTLLRRLAVFAGGWSLEAAEAICPDLLADNQQPQPATYPAAAVFEHKLLADDVLTGHIELVNKSLVQMNEQAGVIRYSVLETLRQFSSEMLTKSGEEEQLRRRHAHLYLSLAEQAEPGLRGPQQIGWLERLEREYDNIGTALGWLLNHEPEAALRLAGVQSQFWVLHGHINEGRHWLAAALAHGGAAAPLARAKAVHGMAVLTFEQGDIAAARSLHEANLTLRRELQDERGVAETLFNLGIVLFYQGDYQAAGSRFEQFLALERSLGDRWGIAVGLSRLSTVAYVQGDHAAASLYVAEGIAIALTLGNTSILAELLFFKGQRARLSGDYATAQEALAECLTISRALGDKVWVASTLAGLGRVAKDKSDYHTAHDLFGEAIRMHEGAEGGIWVAPYLDDFASLCVAHGQARQAVHLLGAATSLREVLRTVPKPFERDEIERILAAARPQISDPEFEAAWAAGRRMSVAQAIDYALNVPVPSDSTISH